MDLITSILRLYLEVFVIVFIDDILVYSHSKMRMQILCKNSFKLFETENIIHSFLSMSSVDFIIFIGPILSHASIAFDAKKIEILMSWTKSITPLEVHSFLGLAGYYRRFLEGFFALATPLRS